MNLSVLWCGVRGHITYAPDETELRERVHADTAEGPAWRCLRCDDYTVGQPHGSGPATQAPIVDRGRVLRDTLIMRFLAIERALRGVVFVAAGAAVWKVRDSRGHLREIFDSERPLLRQFGEQMGWNPDDSRIIGSLDKALGLSGSALAWIAVALLAYAVIEFIEAVGLWLGRRWGEYFAVIATSVFLPLEIYELTEKVTVLRVGALVINIAAVVWLLWSKRLFGLNGGARAYREERESESVLGVRRAASSAE